MNSKIDPKFSDRLQTQADAKKALLARFKPKPAVTDPNFERRDEIKAAQVEAARQAREAEKQQREQDKAARLEAQRLESLRRAEEDLEARRSERKQRKALTKAEQQAKRDLRKAARMAGL